jgi:hypothetical protein
MSYLKFWLWTILGMLMFVAALGVVSYYKQPLIHYVGQTNVTPEQYVSLDSYDEPLKPKSSPYSYLVKNTDGVLTFYYDFYSSKDFGFLAKTDGGILDNRAYYTFISSLTSTFRGWGIIVYLAVMLVAYILIVRKRRQITRGMRQLVHWWEKQSDRKYQFVDSHYITSAPNLDYGDGILCVRSWRVDKKQLKSLVRETAWKDSQLTSIKNPSQNDYNGIHGCRLGSNVWQKSTVMGIVELRGKYAYHPDGVVRAENCKILGLFISNGYQKLGRILANKYQVPVMFDDSPIEGYLHWLYSDNGQKGMQHNFELLKG